MKMNRVLSIVYALGMLSGLPMLAEESAFPEIQRRLPAPGGLAFPDDQRSVVENRLNVLKEKIWYISDHPCFADVDVLLKAVELALIHDEFYDKKHFVLVEKYLDLAEQRRASIEDRRATPWTKERGLVIRGYRSSVDESSQPYGLEISTGLDLEQPVPLVVWLHGRGDKITDLHFLERCATKHQAFGGLLGEQDRAIVLHPFGRQCVGWKHAGEIDVLEAIEAVKKEFPIDDRRIVLAGFSMGGAGAWHIGAHYHERFCAITPGAGFAETRRYNRLTPEKYPPAYEQVLWGLYDVPEYRRNFLNGPLLAYSGEKDKQKAAADIMAEELAKEGHQLRHVVGKEMGHKYNEESVAEIWDWIEQTWSEGNDPHPEKVHFQTRTLRYPSFKWLRLTGLQSHWADTRVDASWNRKAEKIELVTSNVTALDLSPPEKMDLSSYQVVIDGQVLPRESPGFPVGSVSLLRTGEKWGWGEPDSRLRKRPGVQGPIDDAFMSHFVVVPPDRKISETALKQWVDFESNHFSDRWLALMRGRLVEKQADSLHSGDIRRSNLVLWGDPSSNSMLAEIADKLPVEWGADTFQFAGKIYETSRYVPAFIYPNPLNPDRYVVINSGLTFREDHDRTNSLQNPKLPDWAIIDLEIPPNGSSPGGIADAGFFDENWEIDGQ